MSCTPKYLQNIQVTETERNRLSEIHNLIGKLADKSKAFRKFNGKYFTKKFEYDKAVNFVAKTNQDYGNTIAKLNTVSPGQHILSVNVLPLNQEKQGELNLGEENTIKGYTKDNTIQEKFFSDNNESTSNDILEKIANSDHVLSSLAKQLLNYTKNNNVKITLVDTDVFKKKEYNLNTNAKAYYNPRTHEIFIAKDALFKNGSSESVIIHEIIHSLTYGELRSNSTFVDYFTKLYNHALANMDNSLYELSNIDEFMTGLFTNGSFIKKLSEIKGLNEKESTNLFREIFDYILKVLGITKENNLSLYEEAFNVATNIIHEGDQSQQLLNDYESNNLGAEENPQDYFDFDEIDNLDMGDYNLENTDFNEDLSGFNFNGVDDSTFSQINTMTDNELKIYNEQVKRLQSISQELNEIKDSGSEKRIELNKRKEVIISGLETLQRKRGYESILNIHNHLLNQANRILENPDGNDLLYVNGILEDSGNLINMINTIADELNNDQKVKLVNLFTLFGKVNNNFKVKDLQFRTQEAYSFGVNYNNKPGRDITEKTLNTQSAAEGKDVQELQVIERVCNWGKNLIKEKVHNLQSTFSNLKKKYSNWNDQIKSFFDKEGRFISSTLPLFFEKEQEMFDYFNSIIKDDTKSAQEKAIAYKNKQLWYGENVDYHTNKFLNDLYQAAYEEQKKILTDENGNVDEAQLKLWEERNSPEAYLDYLGKIMKNPNYYDNFGTRNGYKYLAYTPKEQYYNPEYDNIKDNELYQSIVKSIDESIKLIPHRISFDAGFLDRVLNDFKLKLKDNNKITIDSLMSGLKDLWTNWDIPSSQNNTVLNFSVTDANGNDKSFILKPDINKFTESNPNDLLDTLVKFFEMSVTYDTHTKILPTLKLFTEAIDKREAYKYEGNKLKMRPVLDKNNQYVRDSNGKIMEEPDTIKQGGLEKAKKLAVFTIQSRIFGKTREDEDKKFAKTADWLINWTRLMGIGLKPLAGINNYIVGKINNYIWAGKESDFNDKDLLQAQRVIYGNVFKALRINRSLSGESLKLAKIIEKFGIMDEALKRNEGELIGIKGKTQERLTNVMYYLMTSGEYLIHTEGFLAKMYHTKIDKLNGEKGSLWEYFKLDNEGNITYNHEEFGELKEWETSDLKGSKINDWLYQFNEYRKATQGDYQNPLYINRQWYWRAAMIFRRWIPQAAYQRFGRESLDKSFKGRYLSIIDIFDKFSQQKKDEEGNIIDKGSKLKGVVYTFLKLAGEATYINTLIRKGNNESFVDDYKKLGLNDNDIKNMQQNIRELRLSAWMFLIVLGMGAAGGGDDDKDLNFITNIAQRTYSDLTFFDNPNSAMSIIRNPLPVWTTISRFDDVLHFGYGYIFDNENDQIQRGYYKGDSKFFNSIGKALPGTSAYYSTISSLQQTFTNRSYKFAK